MSDTADLGNPADLWPEPAADGWSEPAAAGEPEPARTWIWAAMEPADRRSRLQDLGTWVGWLVRTHRLHHTIPPCWYRHSDVLEHLTALYLGWVRTYTGEPTPGRDLPEAEWLSTLHAFTPRLQAPACANGTHEEPPTQQWNGGVPQEWLLTDDFTTQKADHPAEAEALRMTATGVPGL